MKELALSRELYKPNALPAKAKRSDIMLTMKKKKSNEIFQYQQFMY